MKFAKILTIVLALLGFTFVLLLLSSLVPGKACEITPLRKVVSPDSLNIAVLYIRECSNDNGPELVLEMRKKVKLNESVAIVIADATSTNVDLTWLTNNKLEIAYPLSLKVNQQFYDIAGIQLAYSKK